MSGKKSSWKAGVILLSFFLLIPPVYAADICGGLAPHTDEGTLVPVCVGSGINYAGVGPAEDAGSYLGLDAAAENRDAASAMLKNYSGARSDSSAMVAIDAPATIDGVTSRRCYYVDHASGDANPYFVPFNTAPEWGAFIKNHPSNINLSSCAPPGVVTVTPSSDCNAPVPSSRKLAAPYYARANTSIVGSAVSFSCTVKGLCCDGVSRCGATDPLTGAATPHCGDDQTWTQNATPTFVSGSVAANNLLSWSQNPSYTGTAPVAKPAPIPGVCGSGKNVCAVGSVTNSTDVDSYTTHWYCAGQNRGPASEMCSETKAACGSTQYSCASGTLDPSSTRDVNYKSTWTCLGSGGGENASCSLCDGGYYANGNVCARDGVCNNSANNSCVVGSLNDIGDNDNQYLWECLGINGGNKGACSLYKPVAGVCGSLKNNCASGDWRTSTESTTATTYWYCDGRYGGIGSGRCSFSNAQTGVCGSSDGSCTVGTATPASPATDSQYNYWYCAGTNGGDTSGRCSYALTGACNNSIVGGCSTGTHSTPVLASDGVTYNWSCTGGASTDSSCHHACSVSHVSLYATVGNYTWSAPSDSDGCATYPLTARVLVVGGGGGGSADVGSGGGGGSGRVVAGAFSISSSTSVSITVGAGGAGQYNNYQTHNGTAGSNGGTSAFGGYLSAPGGYITNSTSGGTGCSGGGGGGLNLSKGGAGGSNGTSGGSVSGSSGGSGCGVFVNNASTVAGQTFYYASFSAGSGGAAGTNTANGGGGGGTGYGAGGGGASHTIGSYAGKSAGAGGGGGGGLNINGSSVYGAIATTTSDNHYNYGGDGAGGLVYVEW